MSNKYYLLIRHKLHWLEMTDGIEFPIAVIMYSGIAPEYLTELCSPVIGSHLSIRSGLPIAIRLIAVKPVKLSTCGVCRTCL